MRYPASRLRPTRMSVCCAVSMATALATSLGIAAEPAVAARIAADPAIVAKHVREFRVYVDGKARGNQVMTISRRADGSEVMHGESQVNVKLGLYRYNFLSSGTEVWKNGRLIQLQSEADFNGEKYVTQAAATKLELNVETNGESQKVPADVWVASYWREPDVRRGKNIQLLDGDKGVLLAATLEKLEPESIIVDTETIRANHYRLRGDVEVDVWYDRYGLIVRQHLVESGHKTLLELSSIRKEKEVANGPANSTIR